MSRCALACVLVACVLVVGLLPAGAARADDRDGGAAGRGGGGQGMGCIGIAMPCLFGVGTEPRCAARARARRAGPAPDGKCAITRVSAPGIGAAALQWLRARLVEEILPAVCSCYREGLSVDSRLRGRIVVRVRMNGGCGELRKGGDTSIRDRFTVSCVRERFVGFSAAAPPQELLVRDEPFSKEIAGKTFEVEVELGPAVERKRPGR